MAITTNVEVGKLIARVEFDTVTKDGAVGVTVKSIQLTVKTTATFNGFVDNSPVTILGELVKAES